MRPFPANGRLGFRVCDTTSRGMHTQTVCVRARGQGKEVSRGRAIMHISPRENCYISRRKAELEAVKRRSLCEIQRVPAPPSSARQIIAFPDRAKTLFGLTALYLSPFRND